MPAKTNSDSHFDWDDDANMQKLREKKRKAEEAELYNQEETMAKKREAVKDAALRTPPIKITKQNATSWKRRCQHRGVDEGSVHFDDDIAPSGGEQTHMPLKTVASAKRKTEDKKAQHGKDGTTKASVALKLNGDPSKMSKRALKRAHQVARRRLKREQSQLASQLQVD